LGCEDCYGEELRRDPLILSAREEKAAGCK
jgi:hypothetical protein